MDKLECFKQKAKEIKEIIPTTINILLIKRIDDDVWGFIEEDIYYNNIIFENSLSPITFIEFLNTPYFPYKHLVSCVDSILFNKILNKEFSLPKEIELLDCEIL